MNRVEWGLYGETNVDQVVQKTNSGIDTIEKNTNRVQNAFKMSFSSIFLSFLGPMALLGFAISFIGNLIEKNKQKQEAATKAAIDGTNELMSKEDQYWAQKQDIAKKEKETREEAKVGREEVTRSFLENDPRGKEIMKETHMRLYASYTPAEYSQSSRNKAIQDQVQALIAEDMKKNPLASTNTQFAAPSGFSNVIGVGSNPVVEAMTQQIQIQKDILTQLEIANAPKATQTDFTKDSK